MFGSKKNKTTRKINASIKTMDDDIKGTEAKNVSVEYSQDDQKKGDLQLQQSDAMANQQSEKNKENSAIFPHLDDGAKKTLPKESIDLPGVSNEQHNLKASTNNINNTNQVSNKLSKGTFLTPNVNTQEKNKNEIPAFSTELGSTQKKEVSLEKPFLHQATDKINNIQADQLKNDILSKKDKKKSGIKSIILIIFFILLLGLILLGAYYFYMKKSSKTAISTGKSKQEVEKKPTIKASKEADIKESDKKLKNNNTANKERKQVKTSTLPTTFKTTEETFISDLGQFISTLKNRDDSNVLKGGILVTPMNDAENAFSAQALIRSMGLTSILKDTDLKPACKLFVMQDADKIRISLVFELSSEADDKIIKDNIIKNETVLPEIMKKLFINENKQTMSAAIKFSTNPNNLNARYFNYQPNNTFSSVDWNILDLGQGKILYFATSKNLAEKVTNYFMSLVVK